jgi:hypothetical protein
MPVVVHTRDYGSSESYEQLSRGAGTFSRAPSSRTETPEERLEREIAELF